MEELEETAKLALLTRGLEPRGLGQQNIEAIVRKFDIVW